MAKPESPNISSLPVRKSTNDFMAAYHEHSTIVLVAETGSGKSTQIPRILMEKGLAYNEKKHRVVCTQPRRMAAITLAERVSFECGEIVGNRIGYAVRFDDRASGPNNIIRYATDGVVLREAMSDKDLSQYGTIILDEAHERSLQTDILFGLVRDIQRRRKDLKVVVMSATMDASLFLRFFSDAVAVNIPGRQFNVQIYYTKEKLPDYVDSALVVASTIHETEEQGDVLIFMPGQDDIEYLVQALQLQLQLLQNEDEEARDLLANGNISDKKRRSISLLKCPDFVVLPFFSSATVEQQQAVFKPTSSPQQRKFIVATNIAETSVTISGVRYVVDGGLSKRRSFSASTGMDTLKAVTASKAEAKQRSGRAGREAPGKAWRLYTELSFESMIATEIPEIQRVDLSEVILQLLVVGVSDVTQFDFISAPDPLSIAHSLSTLFALGAVDDQAQLTEHGRKMAILPLSPIWAHTLLLSEKFNCVSEVLTCAAILSVEPIMLMQTGDKGRGNEQSDEKRKAALAAHRSLIVRDGDLPTFQYIFDKFYSISKDQNNNSKKKVSLSEEKNKPNSKIVFFNEDDEEEGNKDKKLPTQPPVAEEEEEEAGKGKEPDKKTIKTGVSMIKESTEVIGERRRWATQHFLSWRALERAGKVRSQLLALVEAAPLNMNPTLSAYSSSSSSSSSSSLQLSKEALAVASEGSRKAPELFLKCLACGLFLNVAMTTKQTTSSDMVSISHQGDSLGGGGDIGNVAVNMNRNQRQLNNKRKHEILTNQNNSNSLNNLKVIRVSSHLPTPSKMNSISMQNRSLNQNSEFSKRSEDILKSFVDISSKQKLNTSTSNGNSSSGSSVLADYLCSSSGSLVDIHPSSFLFGKRKPPKCVVFSEIVTTSKPYMRSVTAIEPVWLVEHVPHMFKYEVVNDDGTGDDDRNRTNNPPPYKKKLNQGSSTSWKNPLMNKNNKQHVKRNFMVDG